MGNKVGIDHKLFRNSASFASPTWDEIINCRDLNIPDFFDEVEVRRRGAAIKQFEPGQRELDLTWEMIWDPADTDFTAIQTAYVAKNLIELAFADGAIGTSGTTGSGGTAGVVFTRVECKIIRWEKQFTMDGAAIVSVQARPCYSNNAFSYNTVS